MAFLLPTRARARPLTSFRTNSSNPTLFLSFNSSSNHSTSCSAIHLHRSFLPFRSRSISPSSRCFAASTGPPLPPESDDESSKSTGYAATFSRFQDRMQVFFAVLFWMSLFFWSSAWNGKDDDGRPNKGSRFRR